MRGMCLEPKMTKSNTKNLNFDVVILKIAWHDFLTSYWFLIGTKLKLISTWQKNFMFLYYICQFLGSQTWVQTSFQTFCVLDSANRPQKQHFWRYENCCHFANNSPILMIFFFVFLVTARAIGIWPEITPLTDMKYPPVPPTDGRGQRARPPVQIHRHLA